MPQLKNADTKRLTALLAERAIGAPANVGPQGYYRDLVRRTPLPKSWVQERISGWTGDANFDARELVQWAVPRGINPVDSRCTTLGSLLLTILEDEDVGLDSASVIVALIEVYQLCVDPALRANLRARYRIPEFAEAGVTVDVGPEIEWRGPTDVVELQGWLRPEPPLLDVGFLAKGIQRAASVCRVELPATGRQGTGVLIGPDIVLTNHHVMKWDAAEDIVANAHDTVLRFGCIAGEAGKESEGQTFGLAAVQPILESSKELDYALLKVEDPIRAATDIKLAPVASRRPTKGSGINILQHPEGNSLKLAISSNGVTGVYGNDGIIQYVTTAAGGSSGSPGFDDDWNVIALHHAQRSRPFGRIGEGILMDSIREKIKQFLV